MAAGKSELVGNLSYPKVWELNEGDILLETALEQTYLKKNISAAVIELCFMLMRKEKYQRWAKKTKHSVFDRSIFESLWFAKVNMTSKEYKNYKVLWEETIENIIKNYRKPFLYVYLECNWENFEKRIHKRGRAIEVNNYSNNIDFFYKHIKEYKKFTINIFKKYNINYVVVNTNKLSKLEVIEKVSEIIIKTPSK